MLVEISTQTILPAARQTFGEVFADGTQLQLIRKDRFALPEILLWNGRSATTGTKVEHLGQIYQPGRLHPTVLQNVHLPTQVAPYGSIKDLFAEICNAFLTHFNVSDSGAALLTGSAITTWFTESLPIAPCISVATSTPTQAVLLMRFLACFCYHPLLLGSLSTNGFLSLPMQLTPTLIIHESGLSKKASTLLNASNYRGLPVHKSERLLDLYCAKAIVGQHHATFLENAIQVTIDPPRPLQISSFDERAEAELVKQFQSRLLMYRLENRERVVSSCFDVPDFISPTREIARNLGKCLLDDELQQKVYALLRDQDNELRGTRSLDFPATVIETLLAFCHEDGTASVHVKEIALGARTILEARGENAELSYERTGLILKNLGLHTVKLDRDGKGLLLVNETKRRIHQLAARYSIETSAPKGSAICQHCAEDESGT